MNNQEIKKTTQVVNEVLRDPETSFFFGKPVDPVALGIPDYPDIIKKPMDLGTIRTGLKLGSYANADEVLRDVYLTFRNCLRYNRSPASEGIRQMCERARARFETVWREAGLPIYRDFAPDTEEGSIRQSAFAPAPATVAVAAPPGAAPAPAPAPPAALPAPKQPKFSFKIGLSKAAAGPVPAGASTPSSQPPPPPPLPPQMTPSAAPLPAASPAPAPAPAPVPAALPAPPPPLPPPQLLNLQLNLPPPPPPPPTLTPGLLPGLPRARSATPLGAGGLPFAHTMPGRAILSLNLISVVVYPGVSFQRTCVVKPSAQHGTTITTVSSCLVNVLRLPLSFSAHATPPPQV